MPKSSIMEAYLVLWLFTLFVTQNQAVDPERKSTHRKLYLQNMKKILDDLVIGYDCSHPLNLTSHRYEDISRCDTIPKNVSRKREKMQILQKSDLVPVKAISCNLRRTQKTLYCGNYDHGVSVDSNGFTYNSVKVNPEECRKYHRERELYVKTINSPDWEAKRVKLSLGKENIYQYYKRGKTYPYVNGIGSQISCTGQEKMIDGQKISNIVEHVEDHLTLEENDLLVSDDKIVDKKRNRILNCRFNDMYCYYGNVLYVWNKQENKNNCDLYEAKQEVEGLTTTINQQKIFSSNSSRIHLKIINTLKKCGKTVFETDFKDIFVLPLENQTPIDQKLSANVASIFKAFSIQDSFIFNRLTQYVKNSVNGLAVHHCKDNLMNTKQWTKLLTRAKTNKLQPFSLNPGSNQFFLPLAETVYSFRCKKKLLKPISLEKNVCLLNLPVQELNSDFLPVSHTNHTKYLVPNDRIITPFPIVTPCSNYFFPKFKSTAGKYIAYTRNGIEKVKPPNSLIDWKMDSNTLYKVDDIATISFDIGEGLYDFNTIKEYEELAVFSGSEDQIVSSLARSATKSGQYDELTVHELSPEKLFPSYPLKSIKEAVLNKFVWIGRVCSIAIAVYSIASFLRSICTGIVDCIYLRRIGARVRDLCTFAISPNTYFLNTLPPRYENTYANIYPSEKPKP